MPKLNAYAVIARKYAGENGSGRIADLPTIDEVLPQTIQKKTISYLVALFNLPRAP